MERTCKAKGGQLAAIMLAMLLVISSAGSSALQRYCCQATRRRVGREFSQRCQSFLGRGWILQSIHVRVVSETGPEKVTNWSQPCEMMPVLAVLCLLRWNCKVKNLINVSRMISLPCFPVVSVVCPSGLFWTVCFVLNCGERWVSSSDTNWSESSHRSVNKVRKFSWSSLLCSLQTGKKHLCTVFIEFSLFLCFPVSCAL